MWQIDTGAIVNLNLTDTKSDQLIYVLSQNSNDNQKINKYFIVPQIYLNVQGAIF